MANSQHPKTSAKVQPLLTEEERTACENISLSEDFGKHAKALLALDQGLTQAQAAEKSGLSPGQVRYWIAKFKKERLNIFPEPTLSQLSVKSEPLVQEKSETENKTDEAKEQKAPKKSSKPKKKDSKKQEKTKAKSQKDKKKSKKNKEKDSSKKSKKDSPKKNKKDSSKKSKKKDSPKKEKKGDKKNKSSKKKDKKVKKSKKTRKK